LNRRNGWALDLQLMWMTVGGGDARHGDIIFDSSTLSGGSMINPQTRQPIQTRLADRLTFRGELEYRQGPWGVGVGGWWLDTNDSVHGQVESPPPSGNTTFTHFVLMFEDGRGPVWNQLQPSGNSPDNYFAKDTLSTFTTDLYGLYTLAEGPVSWIDLLFGVKVGQLDTHQGHGLAEHAFDTSQGTFENFIGLSSTASSHFFGAGPMLGLRGGGQWSRWGLRWFLTQGLLIGDARVRGLFTDIDNIVSDGTLLRSDISYAASKAVVIPVSEAQLKLQYDVTSNMSIGVGAFAALWWNVPVSPTWTMPTVGSNLAPQDSLRFVGSWSEQEKSFKFVGGFLELAVRY
jgi:hypothetical protein